MAKTLQIDQDGNIVKFTYEGVEMSDRGAAGTVLRLLIAITAKDEPTIKELIHSPGNEQEGRPSGSPGDVEVKFSPVVAEGEKFLVPTITKGGGQEMPISFVVITHEGKLKVDFADTMERIMGPMMEAMGQAMGKMGEVMGEAMGKMGEALSGAFGGEGAADAAGVDAPAVDASVVEEAPVKKPGKKKPKK